MFYFKEEMILITIALLLLLIFSIVVIKIRSLFKDRRDDRTHYKADDYPTLYNKVLDYHKSQQEIYGIAGEKFVSNMLIDTTKKYHAYVFNDFTFMDDDGYSTNIDHILISRGGIFIIETKANKGKIFGCENEEWWYQEKEEWQDDKQFKNPIIQNKRHINHLRKMMGSNPPKMISMVIFVAASSLINVDSKNVYSYNSARDYIIKNIESNKYSKEFVDKIFNQLNIIKHTYGISLAEHKENIRELYS